jgi:hypothetical protein
MAEAIGFSKNCSFVRTGTLCKCVADFMMVGFVA